MRRRKETRKGNGELRSDGPEEAGSLNPVDVGTSSTQYSEIVGKPHCGKKRALPQHYFAEPRDGRDETFAHQSRRTEI